MRVAAPLVWRPQRNSIDGYRQDQIIIKATVFQNHLRGEENTNHVEFFVEIVPRTDLIGALTQYSVSYIKPADFNVAEKLNEFSLCETARVCSSCCKAWKQVEQDQTIHILRWRRKKQAFMKAWAMTYDSQ